MRSATIVIVIACLALSATAFGQARSLGVGDPVPGVDVESWVWGDSVSIGGAVYLVTIWDKMSSPGASEANLRSLALLKELWTRYGHEGIVIAVVSGDIADRLSEFVSQQRQMEGINLAADRRNSTRRAWSDKTATRTLPMTFIVGNGKILYIGSPSDEGFDDVLVQVIGGRYDPALREQAAPMLGAARRARKMKNWRMATKHYDEAIDLDARVFADVALERFEMMLVDMGQREEAYAWARDKLVGELFRDDPGALRMLATKIMTDPQIEKADRDLDLALTGAQRSLELEGLNDPEALSTVARAHYHRGELDKAISLQTRAYFAARPEVKAAYKRVLMTYRDAASRSGTASTKR